MLTKSKRGKDSFNLKEDLSKFLVLEKYLGVHEVMWIFYSVMHEEGTSYILESCGWPGAD